MKRKRFARYFIGSLLLLLGIGYCLPQSFVMPVRGGKKSSYAQNSFWFYPWGKSVTHKGVDIFVKAGTDVVAATPALYNGIYVAASLAHGQIKTRLEENVFLNPVEYLNTAGH